MSFSGERQISLAGNSPGYLPHFHLDQEEAAGIPSTVLIVTDDVEEGRQLSEALLGNQRSLYIASTPRQRWSAPDALRPHLVLVSSTLAQEESLLLIRQMHLRHHTSVVLLSPKRDSASVVKALDAGADDVLPLPYALPELQARVRVHLRPYRQHANREVRVGNLILNSDQQTAMRNGRSLHLTATEFRLLMLLALNADKTLSYKTCEEALWPAYHGRSNILAVYIRYLRYRLEAGGAPRLIDTVRGTGYSLRTTEDLLGDAEKFS